MGRIRSLPLCLYLFLCLSLCVVALPLQAEVAMRVIELDPARWLVAAPGDATAPRSILAAGGEDADGLHERYALYQTAPDFAAPTTLIGLVNCNPVPLETQLDLFDDSWNPTHSESFTLAPNAVRTLNLRDHLDLGIPPTGVVRITTTEPILVDSISVETGAQRASGGAALGERDLRAAIGGRAFLGGGAGLGTVFRLLVTAPQGGVVGVDPPSLLALVYHGDGTPAGGVVIWLGQNVATIGFDELAAQLPFTGIDAKVVFVGHTAASAIALGLEPPTEDVAVGGFAVLNAGPQLNVGHVLRRVDTPFP